MKISTIIISPDKEEQYLIQKYIKNLTLFNLVGIYNSAIESYHAIIENRIEIVISSDNNIKKAIIACGTKDIPLIVFVHFTTDLQVEKQIVAISVDTTPAKLFSEVVQKISLVEPKNAEEEFAIEHSVFQENFTAKEDFIFIRVRNKFIKVNYHDILYIKAMENFVQVMTEKDTLTVLVSLKNIASQLPTRKFVRVHRSYIINIDAIQSVERNSIMINKFKIPIGAAYKEELSSALLIKQKLIKR